MSVFTDEDLKWLKDNIALTDRSLNKTGWLLDMSEWDALLARLDDSELINEMLIQLFRLAMSDDSNTGKVIRLQQVAQKLEFMGQSEANRELVLREFKAWKTAARK